MKKRRILFSILAIISSFLVSENNDEQIRAYAVENQVAIPKSTTYSNKLMEAVDENNYESLADTNYETFDSSTLFNPDFEYLNYNTLGHNGRLYSKDEDIVDLTSAIAVSAGLEDRLVDSEGSKIKYIKTDEIVHPYGGSPDYYVHYSAFYKSVSTSIYFIKSEEENQRITFYINLGFGLNHLEEFNDYFDLNFTFPVIVINNEFNLLSIKFKGKGNSVEFISDNYATIERVYNRNLDYHVDEATPYKVTMPYIEKIDNIKIIDFATSASLSGNIPTNLDYSITFRLDNSMKEYYRIYPFDIIDLSITNSYLAISNKYSLRYQNLDSDTTYANLMSMKIKYTHRVRTLKTPSIEVGSNFPSLSNIKVNTIVGNIALSDELTEEINVEFNQSNYVVDGDKTYWYFKEAIDIDEKSSGSLKIESLLWQLYDLETDEAYHFTATNQYENVNIYKYSFNLSKAMRVYYYNMSGYYREYNENSHNVNVGIGSQIAALLYDLLDFRNWQCFGFSFYFDNERTNPIPNVQKIEVKYQCGYEEPNPKSKDGFYPNGDDEKKNVVIQSLNVINGNSLYVEQFKDPFDMKLTDDLNESMMTDDYGNKFDYIFYKCQFRKKLETYVTKIDPLKIYYESESHELIQMVGNSKGLHIVLDEDGEYRVYDGDGNYRADYEIGIADDGTKFVGVDENKDGVISTDESVNSDTGEVLQTPPTFEEAPGDSSSILDDILEALKNLKDSLTSGSDILMKVVKITIVVITIILILWILNKLIRFFKRL